MSYIDPSFAHIDKDLAIAYTKYLYGDPNGNPSSWDKPDLWPKGPTVRFVKRSLDAVILLSGADNEQITNLWGGKNAIVFWRQGSARLTTVPAVSQLPTELEGYVTFSQLSDDGQNNVEETTVSNSFGTIPGQPFTLDVPEFWWGNSVKTFTIGNDTGENITVSLTWVAAVLDSAR